MSSLSFYSRIVEDWKRRLQEREGENPLPLWIGCRTETWHAWRAAFLDWTWPCYIIIVPFKAGSKRYKICYKWRIAARKNGWKVDRPWKQGVVFGYNYVVSCLVTETMICFTYTHPLTQQTQLSTLKLLKAIKFDYWCWEGSSTLVGVMIINTMCCKWIYMYNMLYLLFDFILQRKKSME